MSNAFTLEDDLEKIPYTNEHLSLISSNSIQYLTTLKKPVLLPTNEHQSIVNEITSSSENARSLMNTIHLPIRYGSASRIPHDEGFDLKSVVISKSNQLMETNDLLKFVQDEKLKKHPLQDDNLQQILVDSKNDHKNLVQIAKQAQKDFMEAIHLD